jgi:hypothetical protein
MTVVTLNGETRELREPATVEAAVLATGAPDGRGVAVALDGVGDDRGARGAAGGGAPRGAGGRVMAAVREGA